MQTTSNLTENSSTPDENYIARCIEIAQNGLGTTAPNPMVGAVIVYGDKIIGEGYTSAYGGPHAEVNAIHSVKDTAVLKEATLYVTLEPCSHTGKTPPCADLIIAHQIPKVVIGIKDPNEKVAGSGIQKLKAAGCEVVCGILENECRALHKRFLTYHEQKRPYIILKWAETLDGYMAPGSDKRKARPEPYWISNLYSRQLSHQWRGEEQAILVGTNTVLEDNPRLDTRLVQGKNPIRVVLDKELKLEGTYNVLDTSCRTLIITENSDSSIYREGVTYEVVDFKKDLVQEICHVLYLNTITSLIIEGGAKTLQTFIDANTWDEARVFVGVKTFKKGLRAPNFSAGPMTVKDIAGDTLKIYRND